MVTCEQISTPDDVIRVTVEVVAVPSPLTTAVISEPAGDPIEGLTD